MNESNNKSFTPPFINADSSAEGEISSLYKADKEVIDRPKNSSTNKLINISSLAEETKKELWHCLQSEGSLLYEIIKDLAKYNQIMGGGGIISIPENELSEKALLIIKKRDK